VRPVCDHSMSQLVYVYSRHARLRYVVHACLRYDVNHCNHSFLCTGVCGNVYRREKVCVFVSEESCVCVRERETEGECHCVCVCVYCV